MCRLVLLCGGTMNKLFECIKNDIFLCVRNGLILAIAVMTFILCWLTFFFLMPQERVAGNALTLSSWVTQIFIIEGTVFGFVIMAFENSQIQELFQTIGNGVLYKRISKLILIIILSLSLLCISAINCTLGLKRLQTPEIYYTESIKYILLYWIFPFMIASIGSVTIADAVKGKAKYAVAVLQMLLFGPLFPTVLEPLIDITTYLYKYAAMFSLGTLNVSKPMNLMFGYDLQREKVLGSTAILLSFLVFFLGKSKKTWLQTAVRIIAVLIFACGIMTNIQYIENKYDYYVAVQEYEDNANTSVECDKNTLSYNISQEKISISNERNLSICAEMTIQKQEAGEAVTIVLYHNFEIDELSIDGVSVEYDRNTDVVTIRYDFQENTAYKIVLRYHGKPPAHMYIDENEWILPAYVAWYPLKGNRNGISFGQDLFEPIFYDYQQEITDYEVVYSGSGTVYCSLGEKDQNKWVGDTDGITILCSKWMKETFLNNGTHIVYPVVCKNYDEYLETYLEEFQMLTDMMNEQAGSAETVSLDLQSIFFTCDSTYTGHGEKIYDCSDHAVVEITRAYLEGDSLCNPNLTVYPLIDVMQFRDSEFALNIDALYLYKTAYITVMINEGKLDETYQVRSLEYLENLYENLEGNKEFYDIICSINDYINTSSIDKQYKFLSAFKDYIKSGNELTFDSFSKIMEDL